MSKIKVFIFASMAIALIGLSFFIVKVTNIRSELYAYDTNQSYRYDFSQSHAKVTHLTSKDDKIDLKNIRNVNGSVFLKVNIETTFVGKYLQPSITLSSEGQSVIQYFERGAKGIRYINISSLKMKDEVSIQLQRKYISPIGNSVELIAFKNEDIKKKTILILSPHPDDAEIAAYGLYSDNNNSYIVTVTAGDAGKFKYNEIYSYKEKVKHYLKKGELRTWDSITVPLLGAIPAEHILNLGFFDRSLKKMFDNPSKEVVGFYTKTLDINTYRKQNISKLANGLTGNSSWNSLVGNMRYLLEKIKPDIIVTPYPALDTHPDHKFTTIATIEAIKQLGLKRGSLYLYSNHFLYNEYYPYGKMGGVISLPPNFKNNIYFDSIYSHPLSSEKQKDKLFALEAMHDLRLDTEWRFPKFPIKLFEAQIDKRLYGMNKSYFKRSVRSNELFFVVDIKNIYNKDILDRLK